MMRCIAIDDEPLALRQICSYIERTPFLRLAASCRSAVEAAAAMSDAGADLLFVDINMPGLSGLDFVRALPPGRSLFSLPPIRNMHWRDSVSMLRIIS